MNENDNKSIESLPDEDILRRSLKNPRLFSFLIEKYQAAFLRKAQTIVHGREEAEDIVQETFTKMYLNATKFKKQPGIEFKSWAWRILVNTALTHYRKLKKTFGDVGYLDEILAKGDGDETGLPIESVLDRDENIEHIRETIDLLPPETAALVKAHYIDDKPYEEIAQMHGISVGALKMKLFRARKVLKDIISEV